MHASKTHTPAFGEFFELDSPETSSPFIKPASRQWGVNLTLKASIAATILLAISFAFSWFKVTHSLSTLLLVIVYFLAGIPALIESFEDLANLDINIDILMTLAAFSSVLIGSGMEGGLLLVLFALSGAMEQAVTEKAKSAISALHKLSPTKASIVQPDGTLLERAINEIQVGENILVKSGQVVPLDGVVIEGISSVNLVHLTGENFPMTKKVGNEVPAGATNLDGALVLQVLRTSSDSTLAKIIQLVTQAQDAKPKLQRWFDKFSRRYAISIICLSAFFVLILPYLLSIPFLGMEGSVYRALAFLIAASPCALIIAMPIAYLSAVGACAKRGILLKGGVILDALASCNRVAFDKTGTLTTGELTCAAIETLDQGIDKATALSIAFALEKNAVHPIAKAILAYSHHTKTLPVELKNFKAIPGSGLEGTVILPEGDVPVLIGHPEFIAGKLSPTQAKVLLDKCEELQNQGELVSPLLAGKHLVLFRFLDTIRPNIQSTLKNLSQKMGLKLVMLTGDHQYSAERIAKELGISSFYANLKPEDKLKHVAQLAEKEGLAMVGDGINDAPALARATVGICMGKVGTTTAVEAADIVLLQDNIERLDWLFLKAKRTQRVVKQNLFIAIAAIFIATIPSIAGFIPLWLAVLMHEGGTVIVGLNGLRLLKS
ncbi:putative cadmium/zinc-transporting ATPase HMA1 [Neochlamydia sp. TUME1]|uniref:heavy metal translocating P-type ATPase n=1 Tax=Neochlamydia sp. TUME1 TaxID=1478174 RepID=UPI00058008BF|nr:cation-translocating P-type ATPase [Neochlamydia sp. TUME1]KIC76897.1 putative cadmium/zinc-transporting ATPase HMA1 [Neochlamydia sp. TUME1]